MFLAWIKELALKLIYHFRSTAWLLDKLHLDTCMSSNPTDGLRTLAGQELMRRDYKFIEFVFKTQHALDPHLMTILWEVAPYPPVVPEEHRGRVPEMQKLWRSWAKQYGYV